VGRDVTVSEKLLMTDFMNHKIKSDQSFECVHRGRIYMRMFIGVSARTCINICVLKKTDSGLYVLC
jgi:hypothetical protein